MFIILTTIVIQVRQFNNQKEFNNNEKIQSDFHRWRKGNNKGYKG